MKAGTARAREGSEEARPDRAGAERGIRGGRGGARWGRGWRTGSAGALPLRQRARAAAVPTHGPGADARGLTGLRPAHSTRAGRRGSTGSRAAAPAALGSAAAVSARSASSSSPSLPAAASVAAAAAAAAWLPLPRLARGGGEAASRDWLRRRLPASPDLAAALPAASLGEPRAASSLALLQPRAGDCSPGPPGSGGVEAGRWGG